MTRRPLPKAFQDLTTDQIMVMFNAIGSKPEHRVKKTGHIKKSAAKFGDRLLDIVSKRNANKN